MLVNLNSCDKGDVGSFRAQLTSTLIVVQENSINSINASNCFTLHQLVLTTWPFHPIILPYGWIRILVNICALTRGSWVERKF